LVLAAALMSAMLLTLGIYWLLRPTSGLKAANFSRLEPGMTRPDVELLLGGPPGDYGRYVDGEIDFGDGSVHQTFSGPSAGDAKPQCWNDDGHYFYVFFDDRGQVVAGSKKSRFERSPKGWSLAWVKRRLRAMAN
jgi:hypothetical protein